MVFKRYVKRGNKRYGPYYYESYRDENGKVRKRYLGMGDEWNVGKERYKKINSGKKGVTPHRRLLTSLLAIAFLIFIGFALINFDQINDSDTLSGKFISGITGFVSYESYGDEDLIEEYDQDIDLEIKGPLEFGGEVVGKNKNGRMDFVLNDGRLRLYFDLLDYREFVDKAKEVLVEEGLVSVEEIVEIEENFAAISFGNVNYAKFSEEENVENEGLDEEGGEFRVAGLVGNFIQSFRNAGITGRVIDESVIRREVKHEEVRENVDGLDESKIEEIADQAVVGAEDFEVKIDEEKAKEENVDYKWGYEVRLNDLDFMAKIDVTSDQEISIVDEGVLKVGDNLVSFQDLAEEGYSVRFENPLLENELEDAVEEVLEDESKIVESEGEIEESDEEGLIEEEPSLDEGESIEENLSLDPPKEDNVDEEVEEIVEQEEVEKIVNESESGVEGEIVESDGNFEIPIESDNEEVADLEGDIEEDEIVDEGLDSEEGEQSITGEVVKEDIGNEEVDEIQEIIEKDVELIDEKVVGQEEGLDKEIKEISEQEIIQEVQKENSGEMEEKSNEGIGGELVEGDVVQEEVIKDLSGEEIVEEVPFVISLIGGLLESLRNPGGITGMVVSDFEVSDLEYGNKISVYIERDFRMVSSGSTDPESSKNASPSFQDMDGNGILNVGDILYLDPTVQTINFTDVSVNTILVNLSAENNITHLNISNKTPYVQSGYGLTAYWPFDVNHTDISGNITYDFHKWNNDGNVSNVRWNTSCYYGNCYEFDGKNDSLINVSYSQSFNFSNVYVEGNSAYSMNLTIAAWIRTARNGTTTSIISGSENLLYLDVGSSVSSVLSTTISGGSCTGSDGLEVTNNTWHFVALVYSYDARDGTTILKGYVDTYGESISGCDSAVLADDDLPIIIGANVNGKNEFNGSIDDVMIFNNSLNSNQISQIYNKTSPRFVESGFQQFNDQTKLNITKGFNVTRVVADHYNYTGSQLNVSVGFYNGSWYQTPTQIFIGDNNFSINNESTNLTINLTFYAGNGTNVNSSSSFYSPVLYSTLGGFVTYAGDSYAPEVNLLGPANGSLYRNRTIQFAANFTEDTDMVNATPYIFNSSNDLINASEVQVVSGFINSSNVTIILPYDGIFYWNYKACDNLPNCGSNRTNWTLIVDSENKINITEVSLVTNIINITTQPNFTHLNISKKVPYNHTQTGYGLVAYWPFDVNNDSSAVTYDYGQFAIDGNVSDVIFRNASCMYGNCYEFNASRLSDIVLHKGYQFDGSYGFTISFWINVTKFNSDTTGLFTASVGEGNDSVSINGSGTIELIDAGATKCSSSRSLNLSRWHHVVALGYYVDESDHDADIYIDGTLDTNCSNGLAWSNHLTYIVGGLGLDVVLDDIMFFNQTLNSSQVSYIYNNISKRFEDSGFQSFDNQTVMNITKGYNEARVVGDHYNFTGSQLNVSVSYYNGSWHSAAIEVFDGDVNFTISNESTNLTLNFTFYAGNHTEVSGVNPFYSPVLTSTFHKLIIYLNDTSVTASEGDAVAPSGFKFAVTNRSNDVVASIDDKGDAYLLGTVSEDQALLTPTGNSFIIRNKSDDAVCYINDSGYMFLVGKALNSSTMTLNSATNLEFKNKSDDLVAFFNNSGSLLLQGNLYESYATP